VAREIRQTLHQAKEIMVALAQAAALLLAVAAVALEKREILTAPDLAEMAPHQAFLAAALLMLAAAAEPLTLPTQFQTPG
jgi:hypothetical protein